MAAAAVFGFGGVCFAQVPTITPTPVDTMPVSPSFNSPQRPLPSTERVGVDNADQFPLTLPQAIEMALGNNNNIDASRNDVQISNFTLEGTRGVYDPVLASENYFESLTTPTASAIGGAINGSVTQRRYFGSAGVSGFSPFQGGAYSALFNSSRNTTSNTNSFLNPQFPSSLEFTYSQPLLRNRSIDANRRTIEIARKNVDLSESDLRLEAITTITSVQQAYWDLAQALRLLQVATDTLRQAKEQLEGNQRLVAKGALAPVEIIASNSQVSTYEQAVYVAKDTVHRAENTLKTLVLPNRTSAEWSRSITPVTPMEDVAVPRIGLDVAVAEALRERPEIARLETTAEINRIDQRYFRNQAKPQVDLIGSYTAQGLAGTETPAAINPNTGMSRVPPNLVGGYFTSLGNLASLDYPSYRLGIALSYPLRNRTAEANIGRTLVEADRIANNRAQQELQIESEVRNALQVLRSTESRLEAATRARVAAEELAASEDRQFRAGTTTFYFVVQRQTDLAVARGREVQARADLNRAIAEFQRSIGATLTANNVTVSK